jgi:peptide/nickel transport system ATP-binding protein
MTSSTHVSARADRLQSPLLQVEDLHVLVNRETPLIEGLSLTVNRGETVAIVGESGCGKSLTALAIMGLLPDVLTASMRGSIRFAGQDLTRLPQREMNRLRGNRIAMIFQEPLTALNPIMTVSAQITEVLHAHRGINKADARTRAVELLRMVGLPDAEARLVDYPHRLSGGMRQRVTIAIAMACEPDLIIADEPTTALDVTVQARILDLLADLQKRTGMGLMLITHDLGVVRQVADRMIVMYAGAVVEAGPVETVLSSPRHPYTAGLVSARPHGSFQADGRRLSDIPGVVPAPEARPSGCLFEPRCSRAERDCRVARPALRDDAAGRTFRCLHPVEMEV